MLFIAFSLFSCASYNEEHTSDEISEDGRNVYPPASETMSAGSASELKGRCLCINVFVNVNDAKWTENCINETLGLLDTASAFIEGMAESYGTVLDIVCTPFDEKCVFDYDIDGTATRDFAWTNELFAGTGYGSLAAFAEKNYASEGYDNCFAVFHVIADERSYAVSYDVSASDADEYSFERSVIFHSHDEKYEYTDTPYTYAHEILHLFGGCDLYAPNITEENEKTFKTLFPNDVMNKNDDIELLSVSPYTAWCVGWTDGLDKNYEFLIK